MKTKDLKDPSNAIEAISDAKNLYELKHVWRSFLKSEDTESNGKHWDDDVWVALRFKLAELIDTNGSFSEFEANAMARTAKGMAYPYALERTLHKNWKTNKPLPADRLGWLTLKVVDVFLRVFGLGPEPYVFKP
mgnify:CR=1 FL=1